MATALAAGCERRDAAIVVGVTTELEPGFDLDALAYELSVNGAVVEQKTIDVRASTFPLELPVSDLIAADEVAVVLRALQVGSVVLERSSRTTAVAGKSLLLRVPLDPECRTPFAPVCAAPTTCIQGTCADDSVPSDRLEVFATGWGASGPDACKKAGEAPSVDVGEGQADYLPTMDGDVAQVEAGPQGGYHVWVAIRARGVRQSGSVTTITGSFASLGYDVAPFAVVFTLEPSEGGACELYGLRFRIDDPTHPVDGLLGEDLRIDVQVKDTDGTVAKGSRIVRLSDDFL